MLQCSLCGFWGHVYCYGYYSASDKRVPEQHLCYECEEKLKPGTFQKPDSLWSICLFRRSLMTVWEEGIESVKQLASRLCNLNHEFINDSY